MMKSAGLIFPMEEEVALYHEEQIIGSLLLHVKHRRRKAKQAITKVRSLNLTLLLVPNILPSLDIERRQSGIIMINKINPWQNWFKELKVFYQTCRLQDWDGVNL
jgi:hypothetical protein